MRMIRRARVLGIAVLLAGAVCSLSPSATRGGPAGLERIRVTSDRKGFEGAATRRRFVPYGHNYGPEGVLLEDVWDRSWSELDGDLREMAATGANVVRVHPQFNRIMRSPRLPNPDGLRQLSRLMDSAERAGVYLDITGLGCYRPSDTPAWYDALDEAGRWQAQQAFFENVAGCGAGRGVVFCYNLMNEPVSPAERRAAGKWMSGNLFGGFDFVQYIALDPAGRKRDALAVEWIRSLTSAIRRRDKDALITVGLLPWSRTWGHLSGFIPETVAPELDFVSLHIYPETGKLDEAEEAVRRFDVGKPLVIEEIFPLSCGPADLERFMVAAADRVDGWMGHYFGKSASELDARRRAGTLTLPEGVQRSWLELFARLKPRLTADRPREDSRQ